MICTHTHTHTRIHAHRISSFPDTTPYSLHLRGGAHHERAAGWTRLSRFVQIYIQVLVYISVYQYCKNSYFHTYLGYQKRTLHGQFCFFSCSVLYTDGCGGTNVGHAPFCNELLLGFPRLSLFCTRYQRSLEMAPRERTASICSSHLLTKV